MTTVFFVCVFLTAAVVTNGRVVESENKGCVEIQTPNKELTPRETLLGLETELTNTAAEVTDSDPQPSERTKRAKRAILERAPRHCHSWHKGPPAEDHVILQEPVFIHDQPQKVHHDYYPQHEYVQEQVAYSAPVYQATHYHEPIIKPGFGFHHSGGGFGPGPVPALRPPQIIIRESYPPPVTYAEQSPIVIDQPAPVPFVFGRTEPIRLAHHSKPFYIEHFETPVIVDHYQKPVVVNHKQNPVVIDHYQSPQVLEDQLPGPLVQSCDGATSGFADLGEPGVETVEFIRPVGPSISYIDKHPAHSSVVYEAYPPVLKDEVISSNSLHGSRPHSIAPCD